MKKLMTLALALVLVFGMSVVGLAAEGNLNEGDVEDTVDIELKVEPYAKLITPDSMNFTDVEGGDQNALDEGPGEYQISDTFNVQTNAEVTLSSEVNGFDDATSALEVTSEIDTTSVAAGSNVDRNLTLTADWEGNDNDAWESLTAGDYNGTVTVTVSATE